MNSEGIVTKIKNVLAKPIGAKAQKKPSKNGTSKNQHVRPTVAGEASVLQETVGKSGKLVVYLLVALLAVGTLCGVLAYMRPAPAPVKAQAVGVKSENQAAGAYASEALAAWLSATSNDHAAMDTYFADGGGMVGQSTPEYKDLTVASVEDAGNGITTVKLSASIKTTSKDTGKDEKVTWTPYWYQLAVKTDGQKMRALALPTPIAAPETGNQVSLAYPKRVTDEELTKTAQDFLNAYAAGQGDVTRYTTPDSTITPITPAFYTEAKLKDLSSKEDLKDGDPGNGDTAEVLLRADMTRDGNSKGAQYVLNLKSRDGRWEVDTIDSAPALTNK